MRITLPIIIIITLSCISAHAQKVTGITLNDQGKPLAGCSISLKKSKDSSVVKLAVSDTAGIYTFEAITDGNYFISASHIGFTPVFSPVFRTNGNGSFVAPPLSMSKTTRTLKEAVVSARKPLIEVSADKIILNVEGSINAVGQDALELLRKSPGVLVDKDNNLSLSGKNGVQVFIDGRPSPLSGSDLSDYLKTIQSSSIESIEIISNPSARYEAAGNAGIINIRMKKNRSFGTNGSINAGYGIGTFAKYNGGLSFNHRNKTVNIFGNYSYTDNLTEAHGALRREVLDTLFDNASTLQTSLRSHSFKTGLDYFIDKKNTIGMIVSGIYSDRMIRTNSLTPISYIPTGKLDRTLQANNRSDISNHNTNLNLNHHYSDTSGHELNTDLDYGRYRISNDQLQPNYYYDPSGNPLYSKTYEMLSPSDIDIFSVRSDYEQALMKGKLSLGFKTSFVKTGNDFEQFNVYQAVKTRDTLLSNNFDYKENINAAYANYSRSLKGWVLQAGLRVENTNIKGVSTGYKLTGTVYTGYDSGFVRHYTDFFPSAAVTYNKDPMRQWTLNYSRRIDRPAYQDLNPFVFKLDEYTFQKGNTELRPQYTNSAGLSFTYKLKLTTTLNYSHVRDIFVQIFDTTEASKAISSKKNLAMQDITSLNISYPLQYKWYSVFINVNTYYSLYKADLGTGRSIDLNIFAANIYAQQTVKFGKGWSGEVDGFYNSPSIFLGTFKARSMWSIDGGLSKTILKGAGSLKTSVSDIFNTLRWSAVSNFAGQSTHAEGKFESRQFKLNFIYRFGSSQVKAARQRKTGDEDESRRVSSGQ